MRLTAPTTSTLLTEILSAAQVTEVKKQRNDTHHPSLRIEVTGGLLYWTIIDADAVVEECSSIQDGDVEIISIENGFADFNAIKIIAPLGGVSLNIEVISNSNYVPRASDSVQKPKPTNGDSVYAKDVEFGEGSLTDIVDFSGSITDLFNSTLSTIVNNTSDNPKEFTIHLKRPIHNSAITLLTKEGNFSNVKIILRCASGEIIETIDDSTNNSKYSAQEYFLTATDKWCVATIQFHTTDTVTVGFIDAQKSIHTFAHLHALKPDGTVTAIGATKAGNAKVSVEEIEAKSDTPESFEDTSFETGDSPVIFDLNTALERNATKGYIVNDGDGDFTISVSNNGTDWGDEMTLKADEVWKFNNISVNSVRLTWVSDSSYRASFI